MCIYVYVLHVRIVSYMIQLLFGCGLSMLRAWFELGSLTLPTKVGDGVNRVRMQLENSSNVIQTWLRYDSHLVRALFEYVSHMI